MIIATRYKCQQDDNHVICPYCGYEYQPDSDDYDEDSRVYECDHCGGEYHLYQSFTVTHHTKPDCELNGTDHVYALYQTKDDVIMRCKNCGVGG